MSLLSKKGVVLATTSGTSQSVSGFGFTPKVILFWLGNFYAGEDYSSHQSVAMGVVTNTGTLKGSGVYAGWLSGSTAANGMTYTPENDSFEIVLGVADGINARGTVTIDSDGFSITWASTPGDASPIQYLALGGSDLTDATVIHDEWFGTGSKSITGQSFQPDLALFMTSYASYGSSQNSVGMGAAISSTKRWAWNVNSLGGDPVSNWAKSIQRTDRCLMCVDSSGADVEVDFTSMNSDGITVNVITNTSNFQYVAILLKCNGKVDLGSFNKTSALNGTNTITPSFTGGGNVVAVLEASIGKAASSSLQADSSITLGAFTTAAQGCMYSGSLDGAVPSNASSYATSAAALNISDSSLLRARATGSIGTVSFTNTWTTNSGGTEQVLWLAFGTPNPTTGTAAVSSRKPFVSARGGGHNGTAALAGQKPTIRVTAAIPVAGVTGSIAISAQKPTVLAGLFQFSGQPSGGEGTGGDFTGGPPEYSGTVTLVAAKPVIQGSTAAAVNAAAVSSRKPVISITAQQGAASGSAAVVAQKPVISASAGQTVVSSSAAVSSHKPVLSVNAQLRFSGTAAVTAQKPVLSSSGTVGNARAAVAGRKPVVLSSGTVSLTNFTGTVVLASKKAKITVGTFNRPKTHLWPRVGQIRAIKGRG